MHADVSLGSRFTSPRATFGRFVSSAYFSRVYHNYYRTFSSLDNTTRLRGYRARPEVSIDLFGTGTIGHNLEFRTRPLQIFSTLLGVVLFHDVGDAFYELSEIELKQSAGIGIRFLAPQLDRDVLRIDLGVPLSSHPEGEITVNATFGQAFPVL
jgi:outer membrane translocation and assembly module TamA